MISVTIEGMNEGLEGETATLGKLVGCGRNGRWEGIGSDRWWRW